MADKFIRNLNGTLTEKEATVVSAGAGDAGEIVALDSTGRLDESVMPVGIGADTAEVASSENLAAGDFVNIWNDAGTVKVRKADATTAGKEAHGFVLAGVTSPALATIYFEGTNTQAAGTLTGGIVFLSTTAGVATNTAPSAAGNVVQRIGVCVATGSPNSVNAEINQPIVLA